MKKLLLASNGSFLINTGLRLLGMPLSELRICYIITASKGVQDLSYLDKHKADMRQLGLQFQEVDIEKVENFESMLDDKNVIHIEGGNTFYLLKALRKTGFDQILLKLIEDGKPYVGSSAGAYIMCPTIEVSTWGPDVKYDYGLTDLTGFNQVPFLLKVHYADVEKQLVRSKVKASRYPVRILRDGQGFFVDDDNVTFVGEGEEVIIS